MVCIADDIAHYSLIRMYRKDTVLYLLIAMPLVKKTSHPGRVLLTKPMGHGLCPLRKRRPWHKALWRH